MNRLSFVLSALLVGVFAGTAAAQAPAGLPSSATYSYSVVNISQGNKDATATAARPGDTLRYEITFTSNTEDVQDFVASADVSSILQAADMIDAGLGVISGGTLKFPAFSQKAPCAKKFAFFVRVKKDCGGVTSINSSANGSSGLTVNLQCTANTTPAPTPKPTTPAAKPAPKMLPQVGPKAGMVIGFILFLTVLLGIQMVARREQ